MLGVVSLLLWFHRQDVRDWLVVQRYTAPSEIVSLAERTTMTPHGRFLFYASTPEVDDASTFNDRCERREAASAALGCYHRGAIYIYRVSDKKLDGIQEVTAAHEMLHAAWDRLSTKERQRIAVLLERTYERVKTPELKKRMEYYERQQPGERSNELHSIFGTETRVLGDELDEYYASYFDDRQAVVALHQSYRSVFEMLEQETSDLKYKIEKYAIQINEAVAAYNTSIDQFNSAVIRHNQHLTSVDRTDPEAVDAYNDRRELLIRQQQVLDEDRRDIRRQQTRYDALRKAYNVMVVRADKLTDSIDSVKAQGSTVQ